MYTIGPKWPSFEPIGQPPDYTGQPVAHWTMDNIAALLCFVNQTFEPRTCRSLGTSGLIMDKFLEQPDCVPNWGEWDPWLLRPDAIVHQIDGLLNCIILLYWPDCGSSLWTMTDSMNNIIQFGQSISDFDDNSMKI